MFDFLNNLGEAKTPVLIFAGFVILYIPVVIFMMKQKKAKLNKWLADNPTAVKVYIEYNTSLVKFGNISIHAIDGETPKLFNEGTKIGFYVLPGEHIVESSFTHSRPGIMYKTVTETYGPTKQQIVVEANKKYDYSFDRKTQAYNFVELKQD